MTDDVTRMAKGDVIWVILVPMKAKEDLKRKYLEAKKVTLLPRYPRNLPNIRSEILLMTVP